MLQITIAHRRQKVILLLLLQIRFENKFSSLFRISARLAHDNCVRTRVKFTDTVLNVHYGSGMSFYTFN